MRRRSLSIVLSVALACGLGLAPEPAGAADPRSEAVADRAVAFLAGEQRADGGFGDAEAGFPGFETPDAVLAIAEAAQADLTYSTDEAMAAVLSIKRDGRTALDYLDDYADALDESSENARPGQAAVVILDALAIGLDPKKFDPQSDGPTDLVAVMEDGRGADGSYGFFESTLLVVLAQAALGAATPAETVSFIKGRQAGDGSFGDPAAVDTTSRTIQALVAAGVGVDDETVRRALTYLARTQSVDGSWEAFGSPDPNATANATLGLTAAGFHPEDRCWRDAFMPERSSEAYVSPVTWLTSQQAADGHITSSADEFGVNTFATSQTVQALMRSFLPPTRADRRACPTPGYRLVAADGGVFAFGEASFQGSTGDVRLNQPIVTTATTPTGRGYWLFARDGGAFAFGDAAFLGSTGDRELNQPIVAAAATPTGGGYWLFAADGGAFAFGDAAFLGSLGDRKLNQPIVAAAATPTGRGYWLFAADGGSFAFGDAPFVGSLGDVKLNRPIVGGDASRAGAGYWLFADDGGVFAFGDAPFLGSQGATPLTRPIVGGARSKGDGYYLVAGDGGVFAFGDAPFHGSTGAQTLNSPVVGINR